MQEDNKRFLIVAVTNDKYELPLKVYKDYREVAKDLNVSYYSVHSRINKGCTDRKRNCKYIKVFV